MANDTDGETLIETQLPEGVDEDTVADMTDEEFLEFLNNPSKPKEETSTEEDTETEKEEEQEVETETEEEEQEQEEDTETSEEEEESSEESQKTNSETAEVNYEEVYKKVFTPFKANGKEITPQNVEEVVSLMQKGANYVKKMSEIKEVKRVAETLKSAGIDDNTLGFLIDVHKGNPEAIKKLLKDAKVDPLELDLDAVNYVPEANMVSDAELEFNDVVNEIKSSEHYDKVQEVVLKSWDAKSKQVLLADPKALKGLYEEIASGRFDKIQAKIEREKIFGNVSGKTDIERYVELLSTENNVEVKSTVKPKVKVDPTINKKKALPTPPSKQQKEKGIPSDEEILSMSDEEFIKKYG